MDTHVRTVLVFKGHRRTYAVLHNNRCCQIRVIRLAQGINLTNLRVVVRVLINLPIARNPVRHRVFRQVEFRLFVLHNQLSFFLLRNQITEGKTIIGRSKYHAQSSTRWDMCKVERCLAMRVRKLGIRSPLHRVSIAYLFHIYCGQFKSVQKILCLRKIEPKGRRTNDLFTIKINGILNSSLRSESNAYLNVAVWTGDNRLYGPCLEHAANAIPNEK